MRFGTPTGMPGPVAGTEIANFVTRLVAYIIDGFIIGIVNFILQQIVLGILFSIVLGIGLIGFLIAIVLYTALIAGLSAAYFVYFWTSNRATPGMMVLKLQVVSGATGAALTQPQAIRRWMFLGLPYAIAIVTSALASVGFGLGFGGLGILSLLILLGAIASVAWQIYLAYTTNQDARKQGVHDKAVDSVVVQLAA